MNDVARTLCRAFDLPPVTLKPVPVPDGTKCALSGAPITEGYRLLEVVKPTTGEFLDLFHGGVAGYLSDESCRCLEHWHARGGKPGNVCVVNGIPVSVGIGAAENRDQWPEALARLRTGDEVLLIVATDPKKRIWPRARVGYAGSATPVLLFNGDYNVLNLILCDLDRLRQIINEIELLLGEGASKSGCHQGLVASPWKASLARKIYAEKTIAPLRNEPEWLVALTMARSPQR